MTTLLPSEKARIARRKLGGSRRVELPGKLEGSRIAFGVDPDLGTFFQYYSPRSLTASIDEDGLSKVEVVPLLNEYGKSTRALGRAVEAYLLGADPSDFGPRAFEAARSNSYVTSVVRDAYDAESQLRKSAGNKHPYVTSVVRDAYEAEKASEASQRVRLTRQAAFPGKKRPGTGRADGPDGFYMDVYEGPHVGWESVKSGPMSKQEVLRHARGRKPWRVSQVKGGRHVAIWESEMSEGDADHDGWLARTPRAASEQEAEKLEAEAEAAEQQAEADRAKADAARIRGAAGGLYGYTKATQRDVEASVRKAQRKAAALAKHIYNKDERTAAFLQAHAKRASSKTARLILSAMKNLGPKVASRTASDNKVAGGLYGHPTKTARLSLTACSDLRAYIGEVAYGLHSRRTARYDRITGFLKEHGKTAKCAYSRMLLSCYPDAPAPKMAAFDMSPPGGPKEITELFRMHDQQHPWTLREASEAMGRRVSKREMMRLVNQGKLVGLPFMGSAVGRWALPGTPAARQAAMPSAVSNAIQSGVADARSEAGIEAMSEEQEEARQEMLKKAFVPDTVDGWLEWDNGRRTAV